MDRMDEIFYRLMDLDEYRASGVPLSEEAEAERLSLKAEWEKLMSGEGE